MPNSTILSVIGAVLTFQEDEYLYGIGPLNLRVQYVQLLRREPGWARVRGTQIDYRGREVGRRDVTVLVSALVRELPANR